MAPPTKVGAKKEHLNYSERHSLAPILDHEILTAAGITAQTPSTVTQARGFMVIVAWTAADDLLVHYIHDDAGILKTIPSAMAKAFGVGAIYDFPIDSIESSDVNETAFSIALLQ